MDICPKECRYNAHPMRFEQGEILIENYVGVVSKVINTIQVKGMFARIVTNLNVRLWLLLED